MRIVHRQPEDEMPKCEVIFENALRINNGSPGHHEVISNGYPGQKEQP